jgi:hypothetical protein
MDHILKGDKMKVYNNSVVLRNDGIDPSTSNADLNAAIGVNITVRVASSPVAGLGVLASIFNIADTAIANPMQTDDKGNYQFKVVDGVYDVVIAEGTADEQILSSEEIVELDVTANINDLSLPYEFDTLDAFKVSTNLLPVKKIVHIKERVAGQGGGFIGSIISGTGTANGRNINANNTLSMSLVLIYNDEYTPSLAYGIAGDNTDQTTDIATLNNTFDTLKFQDGTYKSTITRLEAHVSVTPRTKFNDVATNESFRPALTGRLAQLSDSFRDIMNRSYTGAAPFITCYGDSNTRYFEGDPGTDGPFSKSYGAYIDLYASEYPALYQSTIDIQGNSGQQSSFAVTNFGTQVSSSSNFVVLGWGTNNVKLANADINAYISDIIDLFEQCLLIGAMPIMLGIPWFAANYGDDGQLSQDRLKNWNATLYALCTECNIPFIDTYNLTRTFPVVYFNETGTDRHYSPQATKQIAQKIIDVLKVAMKSSGDRLGYTQKTWGDLSKFRATTGAVSRQTWNNGGMDFEVLKIPQDASVTVAGYGRGCIAFYPRADATVSIVTPFQNTTEVITAVIDNGKEFYNVHRVALGFVNFGEGYNVVITPTTGDVYIRVISFEDSSGSLSVYSTSYEEIAGADLPSLGATGREYFVSEILRVVRWRGSNYFGGEGLAAVGNTSLRNAVASTCATGYKFYNTTTAQGERYDRDLDSWSAI